MSDTLPLDFVPSSPTGPSGGRLAIESSRVSVVRKGVFGTKAALARPRDDLRGYERGTAADLAERGWMSAGAQLALQRAATVDPIAPFLAIRFEDAMGSSDVWLFRGAPEQMDLAIGALSSGGVVGGTSGGARVVSSGDRSGLDAIGGVEGLERLTRRRANPVARTIAAVLTLGVLGVAAYIGLRVVPDFVDDVRTTFRPPSIPTIPATPPGSPPSAEPARPFPVSQVLRGLGSPAVDRAGVTQAGRQRRSGRAVIIPLKLRGRPLQLVVYPDPEAARRAKGPRDQKLANLLLRGQGAASVAPILFVAVANPQEPVI